MRALKFTLIGLLLLYGCVSVPDHEKATTMTTMGMDQTQQQALQSNIFEKGMWPDPEWWDDFRDPVLTRLIETALKESPTLKKAEERLKAAMQVAKQKKSAFFPEIDLTGSNNWEHLPKEGFFRAFAPTIPPVVNDITLGLSYSYEFDLWGKNRDLFRAAMGQAAAMAAERMQAELILTTSIAYTYMQLQLLLKKQEVYRDLYRNTSGIEKIRAQRMQHALDGALETLNSQFNTLDIQTMQAAIDQEIAQKVHQLKALAGQMQDAPLEVAYRKPPRSKFAIPKNLSLDLIARRPDLVAQKARVEAAALEIGAAKTDFYPNISLTGMVGFETVFSSLFALKNYGGNLQPAIHLPIFTAGRIRAQLMEKVALFNQAVHDYNDLILQTGQEVADRISDMILLEKQRELRQQSWETTEAEVGVTEKRLRYALDTKVQLLDAKNVSLESALALADIEFGQQLQAVLLIRALGGGYWGGDKHD